MNKSELKEELLKTIKSYGVWSGIFFTMDFANQKEAGYDAVKIALDAMKEKMEKAEILINELAE